MNEDNLETHETIVPDTSIMIDGKLTELLEHDNIKPQQIIIPEFVVDELENQANKGREIGETGLAELKQLRELGQEKNVDINFTGRRPTTEEIELARSGRIDALIRDVADEHDAVLYTGDRVQGLVAQAKGINAIYFEKEDTQRTLPIRNYFDEDTMSVHLKEGVKPYAKKGTPGNLAIETVDDTVQDRDDLERHAQEIIEYAEVSTKGLIEMSMEGATVIQIGALRICITKPPFSEAVEITAVRPLAKLTLDDYPLSDKLKNRFEEEAEGVFVAGPPGSGKSTFCQALAEFYNEQGNVVKTMEQPRDLQVSENITQYAGLEDSMENTGDVLLLVRPDYTIYDEVRKTEDFEAFADLRLAGVGMVGVVHAAEAVDAVQRMMGRVELGMIPQVVDTVVFIKDAEIEKVYSLELTVKVPEGMVEQDLARPVVLITDFETGNPEYEIYTYGEETVVLPITGEDTQQKSVVNRYAESAIEHRVREWVDNPEVELVSDNQIKLYVSEDQIPKVIGKGGERIDKIEDALQLSIDVESLSEAPRSELRYDLKEDSNSITLRLGRDNAGETVELFAGDDFLLAATVGQDGTLTITKDANIADRVLAAHAADNLTLRV